jgi:hypothetical protein
MSSNTPSHTINVKRIRNKYDINLNIIIETTPFSIIYEGYKLNTIEMNEVIIETIPLKNQIIPLKFIHPYIIEIEETIYDKHNLYIIYPNYKKYKKIDIKDQNKFNNFFNEFRDLIKIIVDNKIDIEPIKLTDIYDKNNIYVLIHKKQQNKTNLKYGSPIYSPPEIFDKKEIYLTEQLLWNFGMLLYQIIKNNSPYNDCKDVKDILNVSRVICFEETQEDQFLKQFLNNNIFDRISYVNFLKIDITKYNFFNKNENEISNNKKEITYKNKTNEEIFEMDL